MRRTCLNTVYDLAKQDPRIFFVGSDLGVGTLDRFKAEMPDRFFMEGVSEANLVGMAAALRPARHIIQVIDPLNGKGYLMSSFNEGQVSPRVGNFRQIDNLAKINAHAPLPFQ